MARRSEPGNILLVEGPNDKHVLWNLFEIHGIPDSFTVDACGNDDKVLEELKLRLKANSNQRLGIVVDADADFSARWNSVRGILEGAGYSSLPRVCPKEGGVFTEEGRARVGVWIMPNNELPGMLEDFAAHLVPEENALWDYAVQCLVAVPDSEGRFKEAHRAKAQIHTYLAWLDEPGRPIGQTLKSGHLKADALPAQELMGWIRRVFEGG